MYENTQIYLFFSRGNEPQPNATIITNKDSALLCT